MKSLTDHQVLILDNVRESVKKELNLAEKGHDWWHIQRVYNNAVHILKYEDADAFIVLLASLLHDVADSKFHNGDETIGPLKTRMILDELKVQEAVVQHVVSIVENMSYKSSLGNQVFGSKEMEIVQDADRLDAIGAIGIARAFHYGGYKNREMYNPHIPPIAQHTKGSYTSSTAPTINHFYEKLLLLKDKMNTQTARTMAEGRHLFLVQYLDQFYKEWEGLQ